MSAVWRCTAFERTRLQFCDSSLTLDLFFPGRQTSAPRSATAKCLARKWAGTNRQAAPSYWMGMPPGVVNSPSVSRNLSRPAGGRLRLTLRSQNYLSEEPLPEPPAHASVSVAEVSPVADDDFSFTIAIGRNAATREEARMVIDVSLPPAAERVFEATPSPDMRSEETGLYPVASIDERRIAGLIDSGCLLFAYGAFLTRFSVHLADSLRSAS